MFEELKRNYPHVESWTVVDVGAYRGEFAEKSFEALPVRQLIMFEPQKDSYLWLKERWGGDHRVTVVNSALDEEEGEAEFFVAEHGYQSSLLMPVDGDLLQRKESVRKETLDGYFRDFHKKSGEQVILKVDTQGRDLGVVRGGMGFVRRERPVVQCEIIFAPLYENQCSYLELFNLMEQLEYRMVMLQEVHVDEEGFLAYADALFFPCEEMREQRHEKFSLMENPSQQKRIMILEEICQERLELIETLDRECKKRLELIEEQEKRLKAFEEQMTIKKNDGIS